MLTKPEGLKKQSTADSWIDDDDMGSDNGWGDIQDTAMEDGDIPVIKEEEVKSKEVLYIILEEKEVREEMDKRIRSLQVESIGDTYDASKQILQYFEWKPIQATDKYWANREKCLIECGVDTTPNAEKYEDDGECKICLDDFEKDELFGLDCGHKYCIDCFMMNLTSASKKYDCISLQCPASSCKYAVTPDRLKPLKKIKGVNKNDIEQFLKKVHQFSLQNFVKCNKNYKFCPGKNCNYLMLAKSTLRDCQCKCGHDFCRHCDGPVHEPAPCKLAKVWEEKNAGQ
eukprot:UN24859